MDKLPSATYEYGVGATTRRKKKILASFTAGLLFVSSFVTVKNIETHTSHETKSHNMDFGLDASQTKEKLANEFKIAAQKQSYERKAALIWSGKVITLAAKIVESETPHSSTAISDSQFLSCTRAHESDNSGSYKAISPDGIYYGAYQFKISTWNNTALHANRPDLVGVNPTQASPADQDLLAIDLYHWQGNAPWGGRC